MVKSLSRWVLFSLCVGISLFSVAQAGSLRDDLEGIFDQVLAIHLAGPPGTEHGEHFKPENVRTSGQIISALSGFVTANASQFPLSSTAAGLTFDFSSGVPVATATSTGPIFAERAQTLGRMKLNVGADYSHLNLKKLRGIPTKDLRFTFTHENVGDTTIMGDSHNEFDAIELNMNLEMSASIFAFHATFGVTDHLDLGIAVPVVSVSMRANPLARMNSSTYASTGKANHFYGGTTEQPVLTLRADPVDAVASGIGDITLRAKESFYRGNGWDLAALIEADLPTGREEDFLGVGKTHMKASLIVSGAWGNVSPHVNLGYAWRPGKWYRDRIDLTAGYDMKVSEQITLAAEWIGQFEIGGEIDDLRFPDPTVLYTAAPDGTKIPTMELAPTNIPNRSRDHVINSSLGVKYAPKPNLILVGNIMLPVNDGGLRSDFIPTVGLELNF